MSGWRLSLVGALALMTALAQVTPVTAAAPAPMPPGVAKAEAGSTVVEVRRRHHRRHGSGVGAGIMIGIIGGLIAAEAARSAPPPAYADDPRELCASEFRSFEWRTGLYTTYSGEKRLCPYLR